MRRVGLKHSRVNLGPERFVAVSEPYPDCRGTVCHSVIIQRRGRKGEKRTMRLSFNLSTEALVALVTCAVERLQEVVVKERDRR